MPSENTQSSKKSSKLRSLMAAPGTGRLLLSVDHCVYGEDANERFLSMLFWFCSGGMIGLLHALRHRHLHRLGLRGRSTFGTGHSHRQLASQSALCPQSLQDEIHAIANVHWGSARPAVCEFICLGVLVDARFTIQKVTTCDG